MSAQAFIAIEDRRFYEHSASTFGGMMRAGAENLRAGRVVQGGSTITQQLAKNLFLTNERSWRRKFQEIAMAIWLESRFTKDEILALYLSAASISAPAPTALKPPRNAISTAQRANSPCCRSAMIAGLVKAPSRLNPARQDIAAARDRADTRAQRNGGDGFHQRRRTPSGDAGRTRHQPPQPGGRAQLLSRLDRSAAERSHRHSSATTSSSKPRSTSPPSAPPPKRSRRCLAEQGEERRVGQAAAVVMDDTGGVRAMVGGRDYDVSQFNRATQARRQPGSSFKFFIYLAAMENGLTPWSVREDAPITISHSPASPTGRPGNYTNEFHGAGVAQLAPSPIRSTWWRSASPMKSAATT